MLDDLDARLVAAVQNGLPLVAKPYAAIARQLGVDEAEVLCRLRALTGQGVFKRWGVVVKHRTLGYRANAMIVLDVPDHQVDSVGLRLAQEAAVNLCYRRPRHLPHWPYNLFCMIHGKDRARVQQEWHAICQRCAVHDLPWQILFSKRCFKQRGARYRVEAKPYG
jgi:siroheme decarboxylase